MVPHALRLAALGTLAVLAGCAAAGEEQPTSFDDVPVIAFDSLFPRIASIPLGTSDDDPIGFAADVAVTSTMVFVADMLQGNVKVFNRSTGALVRTLGRPGDGPGEFRRPLTLAFDGRGHLLVLDNGRSVLAVRDTAGPAISEQLIPGQLMGMAAIPGTDHFVLAGFTSAPNGDPAPTTGDPVVLHDIDASGHVEASYLHYKVPTEPLRITFKTLFVTALGPIVVSGSHNTNQVWFHDRTTGREWTAHVGAPWYRPPAWSDFKDDGGPDVIERLNAWMRKQLIPRQIYPVDRARFLVRFDGFTAAGDPAYYYVMADTAGVSRVATTSTPVPLLRVAGDTAYAVLIGSDGSATLETRVLAERGDLR